MSVPDTATTTWRTTGPLVRDAVPADYPAIREVVVAAYAQYADHLAPSVFSRYLADLLDLETHASFGRLLVAETGEGIRGFAAFYPDASVQGLGWPSGWAGGRWPSIPPRAGRVSHAPCWPEPSASRLRPVLRYLPSTRPAL